MHAFKNIFSCALPEGYKTPLDSCTQTQEAFGHMVRCWKVC